jgi:hypothetical protein
MVVASVDSELAFAIENDVIVDDDLVFRGYCSRSLTSKRVRPPSRGDSVANPLLGARKLADANALLTGGSTDAARGAVRDRGVDARPIWITGIGCALVVVVAIARARAALADLEAHGWKQSHLEVLAREDRDLSNASIYGALVRALTWRASNFAQTLGHALGDRAVIRKTHGTPRARGFA